MDRLGLPDLARGYRKEETIVSTHRLEMEMHDGTPVTVVAGWEPEMRSFYLQIEQGLRRVFEHRPSTSGGRRWEFSRLVEVLDQHGIRLPRTMLAEIVLDAQGEDAPKNVLWGQDGTALRRA